MSSETASSLQELLGQLITANHILHHHDVVDAYGHISVRNPENPATFFLSRDRAPALVSCRGDLEEYNVPDSSPVNPEAKKGYLERFIHSEIYKKYPAVQSVIHAHAEPMLTFSIGSTPLRPVVHMAGPTGRHVPVWEIKDCYQESDEQTLLVTNEHLGASLAAHMQPESAAPTISANADYPPCPTVLMRGHGFTCVGENILDAVNRAVYACMNARTQMAALLMQGAYNSGFQAGRGGNTANSSKLEDIKYLSDRECKDAGFRLPKTAARPWGLWSAEVTKLPLYSNELASPPY